MIELPPTGEREHLLPPTAHLTPSNPNNWRAPRQPDQRYTDYQRKQLDILGLDAATVEDIVVRRKMTADEFYFGFNRPPVYLIPCPIIGRSPVGNLHVLTPRGTKTWLTPTGGPVRRGR